MKKFLLLALCLFSAASLLAQDNVPYEEKAAQLRKEIWGTDVPEFKATKVPDNLSKESAVILARSFSLQRASKSRVKFMIITAAVATHTNKVTTFHERVKINDKTSLESFSTLEYQKKLDKTGSFLFAKFINVKNTFIGAKIIKPNGTEIIVNTSEEVLLKDEEKDKKGKLAISGLQVGDILDYYICVVEISESGDGNTFSENENLLMLVDEYPVLYYGIDFQYNKKIKVQYIYANNAPHFEENTNADGDLLLSLKLKNIPKYQNQFWTSPLRQYPYIEIGSSFVIQYNNFLEGKRDFDKNASRYEASKLSFEAGFREYPGFDELEKRLKDYFKSSKALKSAPLDSIMKVLYDEFKFDVFCSYTGKELEKINEMNYRTARSLGAATWISMILTDMKIDHAVLLVASRNRNSLENVYSSDDMSAMIFINGGDTPLYMAFDDIVTHFNEIPARFQGERALMLYPKRHSSTKYTFTENEITLPVIASEKNQVEEQLQVSLVPPNMQKLKVIRTVKQTGEMRHNDQKLLVPVEDIDNGYREMVNGEELAKRLKKYQETKKMGNDYAYSFAQEKEGMSKNFITEIKSQYDQEPEKVEDVKIINAALENTNPVFEFSSSFILNNLVKKAGNNYIIDAGKLTGSFYKLEEKERKRSIDVYMPCARTFKYTISIAIPQGYTAKGMEEMNVKKTNKTGSFASFAKVTGNTLTITVTRVYNNNFEKAADWPLLMDLIDTASNFNSQKILMEKKG